MAEITVQQLEGDEWRDVEGYRVIEVRPAHVISLSGSPEEPDRETIRTVQKLNDRTQEWREISKVQTRDEDCDFIAENLKVPNDHIRVKR